MDIDPIVLLAYVSVSINIITMIAACVAYAMFHIRRHRRRTPASTAAARTDQPLPALFLRRYPLPEAGVSVPLAVESGVPKLVEVP